MKIGIFGDSYAEVTKVKNQNNLTLSWPEIISQQYVTENYALSGSCFYYSVDKFKAYHANFDKIIFTVTSPDRLDFNDYVSSYCDKNLDLRRYKHALNLRSVEFILEELRNSNVDPVIKSAWETARNYYIYIYDEQQSRYYHTLMLEDVRRTRPDAILIPCFNNSFPDVSLPHPCIADIQLLENNHWGYDFFNNANKIDIRQCHMTYENNEIFAKEVIRWLNGEPVNIDVSRFKKPTMPMSKYFI